MLFFVYVLRAFNVEQKNACRELKKKNKNCTLASLGNRNNFSTLMNRFKNVLKKNVEVTNLLGSVKIKYSKLSQMKLCVCVLIDH